MLHLFNAMPDRKSLPGIAYFCRDKNAIRMKKQLVFICTCLIFLASSFAPLNATVAISKEEMQAGFVEKLRAQPEDFSNISDKKTEKRLKRLAKRLDRMAEKVGTQVDFNDPVDRWLWFGVFGLGIAIFFSFIQVGLGGIIAFLAIICLVIWIVKRGAA